MKETYEKFCSLPSTTQRTTSEKTEEDILLMQKLFDSNYYRAEFIEFIRPYRLDNVFELITNYISLFTDGSFYVFISSHSHEDTMSFP